jgi:two-component system, LytTR family, sensor kinase
LKGWRAAYAAIWVVAVLAYAGLFAAAGAPRTMALPGALASVLPNAALGWIPLGLARRWPWPPDAGLAALGRPLAAALGVALGATTLWLLLARWDSWIRTDRFTTPALPIVLWQVLINVLIHLALLGAGYAWHNGLRARESQARARQAEVLRAQAELQLLRTQLNPHFILNTLHALLGLVRRDPSAAEAAVERLGELLQFGLSVEQRRSDRVALRDEWAFVSSYLELEQLRLGERLRLTMSADPDALDLPVPPFALQPLVENAIVHAVAPRADGGRLAVSARRERGRLRLEVCDDGAGATEAAILASPRQGLRLLRERLASLYNGGARLSFGAAEPFGLRAVLDLPEEGPQEPA